MQNKNMEIYKKLLVAQEKIKPIKKTEANDFFRSRYFDINALLADVKPILNALSLVITQPLSTDDQGRTKVSTIITDSGSGEKVESSIFLPTNPDPQKLGSAISYFRRYTLQALLGLEAMDDDANSASGNNPRPYEKPWQKPATPPLPKSIQRKMPTKPADYQGDEAYQGE